MSAIPFDARVMRGFILSVVLVVTGASLAACSPSTQTAEGTQVSQSAEESEPTPSQEGPTDPPQPTKVNGVSLGFGGPSNGDLGDTVMDDGRWCQGVTMFWSPQVPEGVTFTVDEITVEPANFSVEEGNCGEDLYSDACLDVVLGASDAVQCGVVLSPLVESPPPTQITLVGTIDCPDGETCAAMADYHADQGVTVTVCAFDAGPCDSEEIRQDG